MLRKCLGAPYPEKEAVEELLKPRTGYSPRVLDIGTGSGIWAIEMSKRFPHAEVIGVDLAPPSLQMSNIPDNCRFEIDDGNLSFTHWTNSFDLVHGRSVNVGIHDFSQFLYNMAQILKPGGMLIMAGGMHQFYDETAKPYPNAIEGQRGFSALQRWFTIVRNGYKRITAPVSEQPVDIFDLPFSWDQWASSNGNFEDVNTLTVKIPVGDWHPGLSSEMAQAGELCRSDLLMLIESWAPTVISSGESPLLVEYWRAEAIKEVRERRLRSYAEWRWLWGRRADCDWIPSSTELGSSSAESKG
ncbi:hypothetical protein FRC03_011628 [Tulasnella sp. 419]|nr:hypothetical protein FRC03_011628 [Tulasnella sp. 419]